MATRPNVERIRPHCCDDYPKLNTGQRLKHGELEKSWDLAIKKDLETVRNKFYILKSSMARCTSIFPRMSHPPKRLELPSIAWSGLVPGRWKYWKFAGFWFTKPTEFDGLFNDFHGGTWWSWWILMDLDGFRGALRTSDKLAKQVLDSIWVDPFGLTVRWVQTLVPGTFQKWTERANAWWSSTRSDMNSCTSGRPQNRFDFSVGWFSTKH